MHELIRIGLHDKETNVLNGQFGTRDPYTILDDPLLLIWLKVIRQGIAIKAGGYRIYK